MSMLILTATDWSAMATRFVGEITLMTVAAVLLGYVVFKALPQSANPKLFAALVPFAVLGAFAYTGSNSAAAALLLFAGLAFVALALGAT